MVGYRVEAESIMNCKKRGLNLRESEVEASNAAESFTKSVSLLGWFVGMLIVMSRSRIARSRQEEVGLSA